MSSTEPPPAAEEEEAAALSDIGRAAPGRRSDDGATGIPAKKNDGNIDEDVSRNDDSISIPN